MKFELAPKHGAIPIRFGMTVEQVRALFESLPESFKRTPASKYPLDYFAEHGVFVNYDADGAVEAVEFTKDSAVTYSGASIQNLMRSDVVNFFSKIGVAYSEDEAAITSNELGVSFWFPDNDAVAESILVFRYGYLDD